MAARPTSELDETAWDQVRDWLEARRRPIQDEIRRYPPPIPACDAHFNYLLDQRAMLSRELVRLEAARAAARESAAGRSALESFVRTSPCLAEAEAETGNGSPPEPTKHHRIMP